MLYSIIVFSVVLLHAPVRSRRQRHCRDNNSNQLHAKTEHLVLKQLCYVQEDMGVLQVTWNCTGATHPSNTQPSLAIVRSCGHVAGPSAPLTQCHVWSQRYWFNTSVVVCSHT